jgi:hypothetical protein
VESWSAELFFQTGGNNVKPHWITGFDQRPKIVLLPDGRLTALCLVERGGTQEVSARYSTDDGLSWGETERLFALPQDPGGWGGLQALVDRDGELQLFHLNDAHTGTFPIGKKRKKSLPMPQRRLDIWHVKSFDGRRNWQSPKCIWKGYTGALNSVIQLKSGRILLPFSRYANRTWSNRGDGLDAYTFMGEQDCTLVYSDDAGASWHESPAALRAPTPNLHAYGAVEPAVLELKDGRVWMVMRTQLGRLYESFSEDGIVWSGPQPTALLSSDSPVGLVRLPDGRIVLLWNSCLRYPYAVGGRHVLHAALSEDDGRSFWGVREVVRDPRRNEAPPPSGDHGTAYPFPALTKKGQVIFTTGQGKGRIAVVRFDPEWLNETRQKEDFSTGLDAWSTFATRGVELIPHPEEENSNVLSICKTDEHWPAAAVWNFPLGVRGRLRLRLLCRSGFSGVHIGLTDHFSTPFDREAVFYNLFNFAISPDGELLNGRKLTADCWHTLEFDWDCKERACRVRLDEQEAFVLPQLRVSAGVCYLRLRAMAEETDEAGFLVDFVECEVVSRSALKR